MLFVTDRDWNPFGALNPNGPLFSALRLRQGTGKPNNSGEVWFKFASNQPFENEAVRAAASLRTALQGAIFRKAAFATFRNLIRAFQLTHTMTDEDERELESELARLQQEHRDLDAAIDALHQSPAPDLLRLQRLKKRKLLLRDRIAFIEDQITPDIIA